MLKNHLLQAAILITMAYPPSHNLCVIRPAHETEFPRRSKRQVIAKKKAKK